MIKLTDYDDSKPVFIDPDIIGAIVELSAQDCQQELTTRTRIDHKYSSMCYLVRETPEEIFFLCKTKTQLKI